MKKIIVPLAVTAVAVCALISIRREEQPVKVTTFSVKETAFTEVSNCPGTLRAVLTKRLYNRMGVRVERVYVNVGDRVKAGQLLASLSADESVSGSLLSGISAETFAGQLLAGEEGWSGSVLEGDVISPIDGVVTEMNLIAGQEVGSLTCCAEVTDYSRMQVEMRVDQSDASDLMVGMPVSVSGDTTGGPRDGVLVQLSPKVVTTLSLTDGESSYMPAVAELYDPSDLLPGAAVNVTVMERLVSGLILAPYEAVSADGEEREYAYVMEQGRAVRREVVTGEERGLSVEIVSGLSVGDLLILWSEKELENGMKVAEK